MSQEIYVSSEYGCGEIEFPLDLNVQISKQMHAADLMVATLQHRPVSADTGGLLAETLVAREQLALLKTYMSSTFDHVIVHPNEDDYLILKAIGERLDRAICRTGFTRKTLEQLEVLLSTLRKGLEIASHLMAS